MKQSQIKTILLAGVAFCGICVWFLTPGSNVKEQNIHPQGQYSDSNFSKGLNSEQQAFFLALKDLAPQDLQLQNSEKRHGFFDILEHDMQMLMSFYPSEKGYGDNSYDIDAENAPDETNVQGAGNVPEGNHEFEDEEISDTQEEVAYPLAADLNAGYLILVNKQHALAENYKPEDLKDILYFATDRDGAGRYLREEAADAFHALVEDAKDQEITLVLTTGYRSYGFQSVLYNNYVAKDGQAAADRYSARPGTSEHQTGLAADVSAPSVEYRLTQDLAGTEEGRWLVENISRFGFILRYPEGKESVTGYLYEPWHIRYVGNPVAEYIMSHGITLEEYLLLIQ